MNKVIILVGFAVPAKSKVMTSTASFSTETLRPVVRGQTVLAGARNGRKTFPPSTGER